MKKRKSLLAAVLSAAVAVTAILPAGRTLTTNAATIETVSQPENSLEKNGTWSETFTDTNVGGRQTWHLVSGSEHANYNHDLSISSCSAAVYASNIDIKREENKDARMISCDIYPNGTVANMRFGILLKYVDTTHWAFLGYETIAEGENAGKGQWWIQWNNGNAQKQVEGEGVTEDGKPVPIEAWGSNIWPAGTVELRDNEYTRVKITYETSNQIKVTIIPLTRTGEIADDGTEILKEGTSVEKVVEAGSEDDDEKTVFQDLRTYADENNKEIYFGFKAGTWYGHKTDINISNVQTNATESGNMEPLSFSNVTWQWARESDGTPGEEITDDTKPSFTREAAIGGTNYKNLNAKEEEKTSYISNKTDVEKGTVSAIMRSFTDQEDYTSDAKAFYLSSRYTAAAGEQAENAVRVGWNGTKWEYKIGNGASQTLNDIQLTPKVRKDYRISMTIDKDNKLTASVQPVSLSENASDSASQDAETDNGVIELIKETDNVIVPDTVTAGSIAITAGAGGELRVRELEYTKRTYEESTELNNRYNEVAGAAESNLTADNSDNKYFGDAWTSFKTAMTEVKTVIDSTALISSTDASEALTKLNTAYTTLKGNIIQQSDAYTQLKSKYDSIADLEDDNYIANTWTEFTAKRTAAKTIIDGIVNGTTAYANEAAITATNALSELNSAIDNLDKAAGTEEKKELQDLYNTVKDMPETDTNGYYDAEAWEVFAEVRNEVKDLLASESATVNAITAKKQALQTAIDNLQPRTATADEITAAATKIRGIETAVNGKFTPDAVYTKALEDAKKLVAEGAAPTLKALDEAVAALEAAQKNLKAVPSQTTEPTVKAGQIVTSGKMDYTVMDVTAKTVVLKEGKDVKQKKVTIPATIMVGKDSYKVVGVAANAFKNYKNIKNITIGANVTSIAKKAFPNCAKLTKVTFKTSKVTLKKGAFAKVKKTIKVKVPRNLKKDKKFVKSLKKAGLKKYKL